MTPPSETTQTNRIDTHMLKLYVDITTPFNENIISLNQFISNCDHLIEAHTKIANPLFQDYFVKVIQS